MHQEISFLEFTLIWHLETTNRHQCETVNYSGLDYSVIRFPLTYRPVSSTERFLAPGLECKPIQNLSNFRLTLSRVLKSILGQMRLKKEFTNVYPRIRESR